LKRLDELVPRQLGEILITHGQSSITDARLCESFLKDYCGEYKEEITLLVLGVKERIAIDLLVSQDAVERDVLRSLLTTRLRRNSALNEAEARWVVDSWARALRKLPNAGNFSSVENATAARAKALTGVNPGNKAATPGRRQFGVVCQAPAAMRSVAFSALDDTIVSGCDDGNVRLSDAATGHTRILEELSGPVMAVRLSPNGVLLATVTHEKESGKFRVRVLDLQSNEPLDIGETGSRSPSLAFSPGGTRLACASAEPTGVIRVWNLQNGQAQTLKGSWGGPSSISFSPDGNFIAAADANLADAAIRIWNLDKGTADLLGRSKRQVTSVIFSSDGKTVASGSWDETVRLWDVTTGQSRTLADDCSCVCCLAFSPQGDKVAASSLDSKIRVWNVTNGRARTIGVCDNINDVAFSTDGEALATASSNGTIRLWDASL
jgi:WD40 repeat protein